MAGCVAKATETKSRSDLLKVRANAGFRLSDSQSRFLSITKTLSSEFQGNIFFSHSLCLNKVLQHRLNIECCSKACIVIRIIL